MEPPCSFDSAHCLPQRLSRGSASALRARQLPSGLVGEIWKPRRERMSRHRTGSVLPSSRDGLTERPSGGVCRRLRVAGWTRWRGCDVGDAVYSQPSVGVCIRARSARAAAATAHLALADDNGHNMIAEIPAPACVRSGPFRTAIAQARAAFDATYRATTKYKQPNVAVTIRGVGFFDRIHNQRGVADNGIELHPVLSINFNP